jgi:hypothetical protein
MATCDMGFDHQEAAVIPEHEPVVVVDDGPNENDVRIAEIEAETSIEREKLYTEQQALDLVAENERLRGENQGMREVLDRVAPPPPDPGQEPVVVPVPEPAPAPAPEAVPGPPETVPSPVSKKNPGWWDGYR